MTYQEALKKVQSQKQNDGYLMIRIEFTLRIILPYKQGIQFIESLKNAEQITDPRGNPTITGIASDAIEIYPLPEQEYLRYKIAELLNISTHSVEHIQKYPENEEAILNP